MSEADAGRFTAGFELADHHATREIADIRRPVEWTAKLLLLVAVLALAAVSFATTAQGFEMMIAGLLALVAAVGLQTTLFVAEVIYSGIPRVNFQKLCAGAALILSCAMSVFFSYAGIRHGLDDNIAKVQEPFILQRSMAEENSLLTNEAIKFKGDATTFMQTRMLSAQAALNRMQAEYAWFREQAGRALTEWRQDASHVSGSADATQVAQLRSQEKAAERRYNYFRERQIRAAATVDTAHASLAQLDRTVQQIRQFTPNFTGLTPAAKQNLLASWISTWSAMPPAFQANNPMPSFYHSAGRVVPPGHEESILGALDSLRHPTRTDGFALLMAFLLDFIPMLAILSTGAREHLGLDARIRATRGWMKRVWMEAQMSDGLIPWTARLFWQVICGKSASLDDPDFRKFSAALDALDAQQAKIFATLVLPEEVKEEIRSALQDLCAELQVMAFRRTSEMNGLVDLVVADLVARVTSLPGLSPQQKAELSEFLSQQIRAFQEVLVNLDPCGGRGDK